MQIRGVRHIAVLCYTLCCIALLYPLSAYSAPSIDVSVKQRVLVAQKRGIVALPFTVINSSNKTVTLYESVDLPEGWRLLANSGSFTLNAGERTVRLVYVLASSEVPAGSYTLPYQVYTIDQSIYAEENISVVINTNSQLSIDIVDAPDLVLAGEEYSLKIQIRNKGNTTLPLKVNVNDRFDYISSYPPKQLTLKPTQSSTLSITAKIPSSVRNIRYHTITVLLNGKKISIDKQIRTPVISRTSEGIGQYHTLPVKLSGNYTVDGDTHSSQIELRAKGSLDEESLHHIDVLLRNKRTQSFASFGLNEEKRISYTSPNLDLHLGDRSIPIAGITDNGFYGQGAEIQFHPANQPWFVRAFDVTQRKNPSDLEDNAENLVLNNLKGLEAGYQFDEGLQVIINHLLKEDEESTQQTESLTGIDIKWDNHDAIELGLSLAKDDDGEAFRYEQNGLLGELNYNVIIQQADPLFDGQIKDVKSESATAIYNFNENKNYIRGSLFHSKRNLDADISRQIRHEAEARLGIGHYFNNSRRDSLYTEAFSRLEKDQREISNLDHADKGIRLEYQKNFNANWILNTNVEFAQEKDKIKQLESYVSRERFALAYSPNEKYQIGMNIDNNQSIEANYDSLSYGLNATVQINNQQYLSGYWHHSNQSNIESDRFQLNYRHLFSSGLSLELSAASDTQQSKKNDINYLIRLAMPLDVPLYKRKNMSSVQGLVIDQQHNKPVANTIITIAGQHAVSDEQGFYQFKALHAGDYVVNTNLSRTDLSNNYRIEDTKQTITLPANQKVIRDITLIPGTGLVGQVRKYVSPTSSLLQSKKDEEALVPSGGIAGLLVTLSSTINPHIVHKSLTNEGGFFSFNGIKAGKWQVQISDPQKIMGELRINHPLRIVELINEKDQSIEFKAIPLIKKIKKIGPSAGFSVSGE